MENKNSNEIFDNDLSVSVEKISNKHVKILWKSSAISDMIADSIIGLALTLDVDPSTAIAQQMMQPVNDGNDNIHNRQSQPNTNENNLSPMLSSKDAFEFILNQHFDAQNVKCVEENA
eukprot:UN03973